MNTKYLEAALQRIPVVEVLVNVVSQRARQLSAGHRPLVATDDISASPIDIALKEIAEGKVTLRSEDPTQSTKTRKKKK